MSDELREMEEVMLNNTLKLSDRVKRLEVERDEAREVLEGSHARGYREGVREMEARVTELEAALAEVKCWIADYTECDCDEEGTCLIHRVEDIGSRCSREGGHR